MNKIWKYTKIVLKVVIVLAGAGLIRGSVGGAAKNIPPDALDEL